MDQSDCSDGETPQWLFHRCWSIESDDVSLLYSSAGGMLVLAPDKGVKNSTNRRSISNEFECIREEQKANQWTRSLRWTRAPQWVYLDKESRYNQQHCYQKALVHLD